MKHIIHFLILFFVLTSCLSQKQVDRNNVFRPEFDISKDNRKIICSYYENNKAGIYEIDITSKEKVILSDNSKTSLINPIYSPDNEKIACISESATGDFKSKICLIDKNSKAIIDLTTDTLLILECVFSPNGQQIFFSGSKYYGNYSLVARKAPHDIDIYSVNIENKIIRQITNLESYNLHGLSICNTGDSLLFHLDSRTINGLVLMSINDNGIKQIIAKNDLRVEKKSTPYEYYLPVLSSDNLNIAFSEPYEIYVMNRLSGISKRIFRNEPILVNAGYYKFFNDYNYLMVTFPKENENSNSSGENFGFYTINPETNELRILDIQ